MGSPVPSGIVFPNLTVKYVKVQDQQDNISVDVTCYDFDKLLVLYFDIAASR